MDALPPAPVYCEAPTQDVVLTVNGKVDEGNYSAFLGDLRNISGGWTLVSDDVLNGKRTLILRAHANVTYNAVTSTIANAEARGWTTRVVFAEPRCV